MRIKFKVAVLLYFVCLLQADSFIFQSPQNKDPFSPCCNFPCLHQGICTTKPDSNYECDCVKGYYGANCEKATMKKWLKKRFKLSDSVRQKLVKTGKLFWWIVNSVPAFQDAALLQVYQYGSDLESIPLAWDLSRKYATLDLHLNQSESVRGLPPVPEDCPTPVGMKGPKKLPSEDRVYNAILKRRKFKPCPYGSNLIFAAYAEYLSNQMFKTNLTDVNAQTSHIYGTDKHTQRALRTLNGGKLKTSVINGESFPPYLHEVPEVEMEYPQDSTELNSFKPFVVKERVTPKWAMGNRHSSKSPLLFIMGTIWLREHNRVADILWKHHPDWDDERLYQTAKLVLLGEFLTITLGDFAQHLSQSKLNFNYKPELLHESSIQLSSKIQQEFNLLFHWYQTIPDELTIRDKTYDLQGLLFGNNRVVFEHSFDASVDAMARSPAGEITYRNSGKAMEVATKELISQGRKQRLHSFNNYRKSFDLEPYKSFKQLVDDDEIAKELEELYGHIDAVEFIVGALIEKHHGAVVPPTTLSLGAPMAIKKILSNPIGSPAFWRPSTFGGKVAFKIVTEANLQNLFCNNLKGRCKNNVWVSFRVPKNVLYETRKNLK